MSINPVCRNYSECLWLSVAACGVITAFAGAFFLLASHQIFPAGVNAISRLGVFSHVLGFGALPVGLFLILLSAVKGRSLQNRPLSPPIPMVEHPCRLPDDVARYIMSFLDVKDLVPVSRVCKKWHLLSNDNSLWKRLVEQSFPPDQVAHFFSKRPDNALIKDLYILLSEVHFRHILNIQTFNHGCYVMETALLEDVENKKPYLFSHSLNGTVKVWDMENEACVLIINYRAILDDNEERAIYECRMAFLNHQGFLISENLYLNKNILYVAWNENPDKGAFTITKKIPESLDEGYIPINFMSHLVIGESRTISIIDIKNKVTKIFYQPKQDLVSSMRRIGNTLITGSASGYVRFWNFNTPELFKSVRLGYKSITHLDYRMNRLFCSSANGKVYVLKFAPAYLNGW